jgi:hypothetical protein
LGALEKAFADIAKQPRILHGAVLEHAFPTLESQIEAGEIGITLFELIDHAKRLQVVFEASVFAHAFVERILAGVSERGVSEVMSEAYGLGQGLIEIERPGDGTTDLRDLERMRDAGSIQVAFMIDEYLCLVDEPPKRIRVDDAIAIALKLGAKARRGLGKSPAATLFIDRGVSRERLTHALTAPHAQRLAQRCVIVVAGDHGFADGFQQHEANPSGGHLLVDLHLLRKSFCRE